MLSVGDVAPAFDLPNADMELVSLAQLNNNKNVVLYFYPKDDNPDCTLEAIDFSDLEPEFVRSNCVVLGVSMDDCLSHASFRDKHGLSLQLLADADGEVCAKYKVLHEKHFEGGTKTCIQRSTFVIDQDGVIQQALYGVNPRGHANEVLSFVKELSLPKQNSSVT